MPLKFKDNIAVLRLRGMLRYDPVSGVIVWIIKPSKWKALGTVAGTRNKYGYIIITWRGSKYHAHRIAWALYYGKWPTEEIDHKNRNRSDNCITNLRPASAYEQKFNQKMHRNNTTGYRGITMLRHVKRKPWCARINYHGKRIHLGQYLSKKEAGRAYDLAAHALLSGFYREP